MTQRARDALIAFVAGSSLNFGLAQASQVLKHDKGTIQRFNITIKKGHNEAYICSRFVAIYKISIRPAIFSDASFAPNQDLTSQRRYVIGLVKSIENTEIIYYSSVKSERVTKSVLAAELFAAVSAFDTASTVRASMNGIFDCKVLL